jgi:glycosyltransferase involved in cell wall biosynthesis
MTGRPDRTMSVVLVAACPFPAPRGTPVRIARMAEALRDRGHDVRVVSYHLAVGEDPEGIEVHRTPRVAGYRRLHAGPSLAKLLVMDPLLVGALKKALRRRPADLVHAHHVEGLGAAAAGTPPHTPIVYDAHTLLSSELPRYGPRPVAPLAGRWGRWVDGACARRADHVVTVTTAIADSLVAEHAIPATRVTVVPNGVELHRFTRARLGSPVPHVVFAGALTAYQGIEVLLDAFARLRIAHPDALLTLAVSQRSDLAWVSKLRGAELTEAVRVREVDLNELASILASATVAVNPRPEADGQPLKLLNYMAAGAPIVACRGSAHGLIHDRTAWLVDDDDPIALAAGLCRLIEDPSRAARLGAAARRSAEAIPTWSDVAERLEGVYAPLVDRPILRHR